MENQIIQINLVPNMSTPAVVRVSQYDVGRPLVFKVYDGTSPADLTGVTAVVEGTKKSGLGFSESGTVADNTVTLNTTLAMTQEDGSIPAEIRFSKTGEDVGTANFILAVEKSPHLEGTTDGTTETMADLQSQLDALDERVEALEGGGGGLTETVKSAMLQIAQKVAYIDEHGQTYYDALYDALYPPAELVSISAVYTQSGTVYDTDTLDSLRSDLVVTATYSDSTTAVVTDYTLSGTLTAGTSTITVSYGGKTTTFNVTVETAPLYSIPDFAEQTVTKAGRTATIKKENGYYTISGTFDDVAYIYPNGTVNLSKSNTLWFTTPADKPIIHEIYDITWNNPTAQTQDLACKFSQSNTTGNKATVTYTMSANSSGTDGSAEFTNDAYPSANFSAFCIQVYHSGSTRSSDVSVTFKMRLFCDGVRYL